MDHLPTYRQEQERFERNVGIVAISLIAVTIAAVIGTAWWAGRVLNDLYHALH